MGGLGSHTAGWDILDSYNDHEEMVNTLETVHMKHKEITRRYRVSTKTQSYHVLGSSSNLL